MRTMDGWVVVSISTPYYCFSSSSSFSCPSSLIDFADVSFPQNSFPLPLQRRLDFRGWRSWVWRSKPRRSDVERWIAHSDSVWRGKTR